MKFLYLFSILILREVSCSEYFPTAKPNIRRYEHPYGAPKTLFSFPDNKPLVVYDHEIKSLFHEQLGDYKIAIYPIVGAFRMGKSFFLDYALRFLYANYKSFNYASNPLSDPKNWMGYESEPLTGFSWRPGAAGNTAGMNIWSDVFYFEENGEKTAILLMDTQGMFDTAAKMMTSTRIFTLNSLFASFLIFISDTRLQEDALSYLGTITEFARLVYKMSFEEGISEFREKPFQDLLFLFRNWPNPADNPFGLQGGTDYILEELKTTDDGETIGDSKKVVRETIHETYQNIHGYLLPHPGKYVAGNSSYLGQWADMDEEFREHYFNLIEWMFKKENIVKKKILGHELNGKQYYSYVKAYCDIYRSADFPQSPDIYNVTVDSQHRVIIDEAVSIYKTSMREYESLNVTIDSTDLNATFTEIHNGNKEKAVENYRSKPKLGSKEVEGNYEKELISILDNYFEDWNSRVMKYYESFIDLQRKANQTITNFMIKKEEDMKLTIQKHNATLEGIHGNISAIAEQLENETRQNEIEMEKKEEEMMKLQDQLHLSILSQELEIEKQQKELQDRMNEIEDQQRIEKQNRAEADRKRAAEFKAKMAALNAQNLKDSEEYHKLLRENEEKIRAEEELREQEDRKREREMAKLRRERLEADQRIRDNFKARIEAEKQELENMEAKIKEFKIKNQAALQKYRQEQIQFQENLLNTVRENNEELYQEKMRGMDEMRELREDFSRRMAEERRWRDEQLASMRG